MNQSAGEESSGHKQSDEISNDSDEDTLIIDTRYGSFGVCLFYEVHRKRSVCVENGS